MARNLVDVAMEQFAARRNRSPEVVGGPPTEEMFCDVRFAGYKSPKVSDAVHPPVKAPWKMLVQLP